MFVIRLNIFRVHIILLSLNTNGFFILRIGKEPRIQWTLFAFYYERSSKRLCLQFFSMRSFTLGRADG